MYEKEYIEAYEMLKQLIAIPSVSREEGKAAEWLEGWLQETGGFKFQGAEGFKFQEEGFRGQVHRQGNNLWLVDPNFSEDRPTLLLNAHIDTVKPVASWKHDPFCPTEEQVTLADGTTETRLYGLGSNDDGASLVSLLQVYLLLTKKPQAYNVIFLASAEEEVSGKNGIESVLPLLPPIHTALVGEPTGMQPAVAEKGLVVLDGKAYGKSGHAARNEGINALYLAVDAIEKLRNFRFEKESKLLGPVKVTVTGIQAGTVHNVVPDCCSFMVDCRTTDAYSNEEVVRLLKEAVEEGKGKKEKGEIEEGKIEEGKIEEGYVTLEPRSTRLQPSGIDPKHPLLQRIVAIGRKPFGSPTLSDQALMRFPSLKMGPGQSARSHTADEYIRPEEIREAIEIYMRVLDGMEINKM